MYENTLASEAYAESLGLKVAYDVDVARDYEFDIITVWKHEEGFYIGTDSGCSCPTPFEGYSNLEDLTGPLTKEQVIEEVGSLIESNTYISAEARAYALSELDTFDRDYL